MPKKVIFYNQEDINEWTIDQLKSKRKSFKNYIKYLLENWYAADTTEISSKLSALNYVEMKLGIDENFINNGDAINE